MSSSSATPRNGGENTPQSSSHTNRSGRTAATRRAHGKVLAPVVDSSEDEPSPHSSIFEAPLASDSENEGGGNGGGGAGAGGGGGVGSSSSAARKGFNSGGIKIIQSSDVSGVGGERSQMGQSPGSYGSYSTSNTAPQPPHIHTSQQQQQPLNLSSSPPAVGAALLNSVPSDGGRSFDNRRTAAGRPSHNHNNLETITEQKSASDTAPPREDEIVAAEAAGSRSRSRSSSLGSDFSDGEDDEDDADEEVGDDAQLLPRGRRKKPSSEAYSNSNSRRSNYFDYYDAGEVYDYVSPSQPLYQSIAAMNNTDSPLSPATPPPGGTPPLSASFFNRNYSPSSPIRTPLQGPTFRPPTSGYRSYGTLTNHPFHNAPVARSDRGEGGSIRGGGGAAAAGGSSSGGRIPSSGGAFTSRSSGASTPDSLSPRGGRSRSGSEGGVGGGGFLGGWASFGKRVGWVVGVATCGVFCCFAGGGGGGRDGDDNDDEEDEGVVDGEERGVGREQV